MKKTFYFLMLMALVSYQAHSQSPTAPAQNFNVFVQNGATLITNETEGPAAIGGDLTLNGDYRVALNNAGTFLVGGAKIGLLVGGKVNYSGGNGMTINSNGYVKIGNANGSTAWYLDNNGAASTMRITPSSDYNGSPRINIQAHASDIPGTASALNNPMFEANLIDFAAAFTTMKASALSISGNADNAHLTNPNGDLIPHTSLPNQVKITLNSGINFLNLTGADMNNVQNFTFNNSPDAGHVLVINVNAPGTFNWNAWGNGSFGGQSNCAYILYNFYNTTTLNISGNAIEGTVFAPFADITKSASSSNLEGQVIAQSYYHSGGENHYANFTTTIPGGAAPTVPSFSINNSTQCLSGNSFTFTNSSTGTAPFTYKWSFGDNTTSTDASPVKTYAAAGNYTVKVVVTGAGGTDSTTHSVTVNSTASQPGAFTASSATTYQGQVSVTYTIPNDPTVTYNWSYSGTGATIHGTGNSVTIDFGITATSGTLSVTATAPGSCGASTPRTMAITVKPYITWTCHSSTDWNTASNWDAGFAPYGTISVLIPANTPCQPTIDNTNSSVRVCIIDSGAVVTINDNASLHVNGDLTCNGNVSGTGYISCTGGAGQKIYGHGKINFFEMNNHNNCTINSGDTIHIVDIYKPTDGTLYTNGGLELLSDSTTTAQIITAGNCNYISGEVICDKWIHGGKNAFRFLGHPYTHSIPLSQLTPYIDITGQDGAANGFTTTATNNPSSFWYHTALGNGSSDDDSTGWIPFTNTNGLDTNAWNAFEGLRVLIRGAKGEGFTCCYHPSPVVIKTHGSVSQCDVNAYLATNSNYGFNFISNPYPCNIDMSQTGRGTGIGANFSVWDPNQGLYGAYVDQPFQYSYVLPAYSAFMTTCTDISSNFITFHESDKTPAVPTGNLFKTTSAFGGDDVVQLHIVSNNDSLSWDRLLLFFNGQSMAAQDAKDAKKMSNPDLDFYTFSSDANKLSIDVRPFVSNQVIQLGLTTDVMQSYSIRVDDYTIPAGTQLYLHDKYLSQTVQLSQGMHYNFSVTSDIASQGDNRFELNLTGTPTSVGSVVASNELQMNIVPNPASDRVNINFDAPQRNNTTVRINNIMGQQVFVKNLGQQQSGSVDVSLQNLSAGVYIVTINCGDHTITKRLVKN